MKVINRLKNSYIDIAEINELAKNPAEFIESCENNYHSQINDVVQEVISSNGRYRVLLLAGPSSSGKTTTAHKISDRFSEMGIVAPVVSLDDFFLGMENYPKLPNGKPDMESVEALDLPLINQCLKELIENGESDFPTFDFEVSSRSDKINKIKLPPNGVLVVEGLHALNPRLIELLDKSAVYRVYVSAHTKYMSGDIEVLSPKDMRLIRRMVRDHNFRGRSPINTIISWKDVLDGEEKYIYPFRDDVDYRIDSALDYEDSVFHHYILPMVEEMKQEKGYEGKVKQIVDILEAFDDIDYQYIPENSLLREFIGHKL